MQNEIKELGLSETNIEVLEKTGTGSNTNKANTNVWGWFDCISWFSFLRS